MLKTKDGYAKVIGTSYNGSSDYLLLSNGDSKAISSLSVNYANNADKLDGEHASSFVRAGVIDTDVTDLNALDTYSFIKSVNSEVANHSPKGNTGWYNVIQLVHRNGSGDGPGYIGQIALGMTTNTNDMFFRGKRTDSWKTVIHSGNIADQSVKYATNSGNADTVDGTHLNGIFTAFGNNAHNITATIGGVTKSFLVNWAADSDKLDGYHANTVYNAPSFTVNNGNTSNTYILLATITISGTSLSCSEFTILFQNRECLDNSSFILSGAIRRNSTTNVSATLSYITLHTEIPRNIYLRSNDGVTFMVYIQSAASAWTTYYRAIPIVDSGNIIYSNTGTTSPISGSVLNITATKGGNVNYANSAGSVAWNNVTGRPSTFAPSAHTHKWADITDHITKLSQLTNDKGFVTGSVSGNTITINGSSTTWSDTWRPITDDYELGESDTSLSTLGSLTLYTDLLGSIPNPTDYYWANNKVSNKSTTEAKVQLKAIGVGCAASIDNSIIATNWIRAKGDTGIYFQDHGGGLYMSDDTWIRTWAGKALQVDNTIRSTDFHTTYYANNVWTITSAAKLENSTTLIYGFSTSSNNINTYLRGTNITLQVKNGTSINYNAFQVTADETRCFNYFNMKGGATVSNGNLTVQNNAYLAQKAGTKVGIGTSSPQSTLDIKGSGVAPLRVNGSIELCHDNTYLVQPLILAYGAYYGSQLGVSCSTPITVMSYTDQIVINFINIKKSSFTNNNFAFYMTPLDSSANISTYVRFNETSGPIVSVHIKNPVKLHQFSFILYVYQSKLKTYTIDFLS